MGRGGITVLMTTRNGAAFVDAQLRSIAAQIDPPAALIVSDDGSTDDTCAIIRAFGARARFPVRLVHGPKQGVALNFLSLLAHAPDGPVALADQDDVWWPAKLARAHAMLSSQTHAPALYTARRVVTDAQLRPLYSSPKLRRAPGFANALVQNIAPANTIVLNRAAARLARAASTDVDVPPPFHDWWLYQLVAGADGKILTDDATVIYYRQHGRNLFGAGQGGLGRLGRLKMFADGTYGRWVRDQARALSASAHRLSPAAADLLHDIKSAPYDRALPVGRFKLYRQHPAEQLLLRGAALFGRL